MNVNKLYKWFTENIEDLYKKYGQKFLVIKDKTIIGDYETFQEAFRETMKIEKIGTFIIQECFPNKKSIPCVSLNGFYCK